MAARNKTHEETGNMDSQKLCSLVKTGNVEGVRKLVRQGIPMDCIVDRYSPLMQAAKNKKEDIVRLLLEMGASVDFTNDDGLTALHYAATLGAVQEAEALLEAGAQLEAKTNTGRTPLSLACRNGRLPMAKKLLEGGADVEATDDEGWSLLFMAARRGSLPVVKWLVEELNVNTDYEVRGRTAAKLAEDKKHSEVASYLRNLGNLPSPVKTEPRIPRKVTSAAPTKDSRKMPEQANSVTEACEGSPKAAVGPADLKVKHVDRLVEASDDVYDTTMDPPGLVLLLMYRTFSVPEVKDREGAEYDVVNIVSLFEQMGYEVEPHLDKTWDDTIWILEEFSKSERLRKVGCAIVIVSSHGGNEKSSFSTSDGQDVSVNYLHELFINDQSLEVREMPKLFFLQFCRGDIVPQYYTDNISAPPENIISFFSTSDGFVSYRDKHRGSMFLIAVCEVLAENAHTDCLDDLFRKVQRRYKKKNQSATPEKQDLGFIKKFYFNPRLRK